MSTLPHLPSGFALAAVGTPTRSSPLALPAPGPDAPPLLFSLLTADALTVTVAVGLVILAVVVAGALDRLTDGSLRNHLVPATLWGEATETVPPKSALSEEEQFVVKVLRQHGGQVHQSTIVEVSDWSKSKVSRLLSSMEAEGYVEKQSVGRENLISLPGEEPPEE